MLVPPLTYYKELASQKAIKEKEILSNNFEEKEIEGTEIELDSTAEAPLEVVEIAGNIKQDIREGYNILKNELTSKNINGVTVTVYDDGSFRLDGTSTGAITLVYTSKSIKLLGDYVFYLYGKKTGINLQGVEDSSTVSYILSSNNSEYFSKNYSEETELTQVFSYIANGTTFSNNIFKPMISKGNEVKPFQQYGSMPSLEYESEVVGVTGDTKTQFNNKNFLTIDLLEKNKNSTINIFSSYGIEAEFLSDGGLKLNGTLTGTVALYLFGNNLSGTDVNLLLSAGNYYFSKSSEKILASLVYNNQFLSSIISSEKEIKIHGLKIQVNEGVSLNNEIIYFQIFT